MENFKYQGTPEQMAKVADYLVSKSYNWWNVNRSGPFLKCTLGSDNDFFYASTAEDYGTCIMPPMPAALELEIFGSTQQSFISEDLKNPWRKNHGECPEVGDNVTIELLFEDTAVERNVVAGDFDWTMGAEGCGYDITHWRYHNVEDVPDYFVQPKTASDVEKAFEDNKHLFEAPYLATPTGPVKSDGGSSSYYKLTIKTKDGSFECETGDVIAAMVGNDFNLGNALKALRRIWCASQGFGKEGIDQKYDARKVQYFLEDHLARMERV